MGRREMEDLYNSEANKSNNNGKNHLKKTTLLEVSAYNGPTKGIFQFFLSLLCKEEEEMLL